MNIKIDKLRGCKGKISVYALVLMVMWLNQGHAALLTNGSFEDGLTGWTVNPFSGGTIVTSGVEGSSDGTSAAIFNGGDQLGGTLSQTFSTTIGTEYRLEFDFGVYSGSYPGSNLTLQVDLNGVGSLLSTAVTYSASSPTQFNGSSFNFTADSSSTTLLFTDFTSASETISVDSVLDNVSVSSVPIPAAVWLFSSGIIGIIGIGRKRERIYFSDRNS